MNKNNLEIIKIFCLIIYAEVKTSSFVKMPRSERRLKLCWTPQKDRNGVGQY